MYVTVGQEDTASLGQALGSLLEAGDSVRLVGQMGMGKSVLARGIARALGVTGPMPSPTFTLMQPYAGRVPVHHFDLFRLCDEEEFYAAGFDELVGREAVSLIEWPLDGLDFAPCVTVTLTAGPAPNERAIAISFDGMNGEKARALLGAVAPWEAPL